MYVCVLIVFPLAIFPGMSPWTEEECRAFEEGNQSSVDLEWEKMFWSIFKTL